ncbi:DUF5074 domain-containing protein [Hymenobacter sp. B81]|uniref:DUF5074 domain-containing protein n=1 Tax=Hymenobacter sp. B81 TaxID=3344878 RepID=UPI0037DC67D7
MLFTRTSPLLRRAALGLSLLAVLTGCGNDDEKPKPQPLVVAGQSVLVVNEGTTKGAVSLFDKASRSVQRDIFKSVNARELGKFVQSMTVVGEQAYVVVNGDGTIQVVNVPDFKQVAEIKNLSQPRFMAVLNGKGYVTEWQGTWPNYTTGRVSVINLATNSVERTINTGIGINPEHILAANGKVYVANSYGTTISVIDPAAGAVTGIINAPMGPKHLALDANGNMWALCSMFGGATHTLFRFNPAQPSLTETIIPLPFTYGNGNLIGKGNKMYASLGSQVYALDLNATTLPARPLIARDFYGLGIDPKEDVIYGGDAGNFTSDGRVVRYSLTGTALDSFNVAIAPNSFVFY